jgi:hypothetical protein
VTTRLLQTEPASLDDLEPYRGEWVALVNRHVVAHAPELETLFEMVDRDGVEYLFVPSESSGIYIL